MVWVLLPLTSPKDSVWMLTRSLSLFICSNYPSSANWRHISLRQPFQINDYIIAVGVSFALSNANDLGLLNALFIRRCIWSNWSQTGKKEQKPRHRNTTFFLLLHINQQPLCFSSLRLGWSPRALGGWRVEYRAIGATYTNWYSPNSLLPTHLLFPLRHMWKKSAIVFPSAHLFHMFSEKSRRVTD